MAIKNKVIYARSPKNKKIDETQGLTGHGSPNLGEASGKNTTGKAKRASDIVREFGEKLDMTIRKDRVSAGRIGEFNRRTYVIRIKKANDIPTLSHETGHFLDMLYSVSKGTRVVNKQLEALGKPVSRKSYSPAKKRREGFAEFIRMYLTGGEDTLKADFSDAYDHAMSQIPPDVMKVINELRDDVWNLTNLEPAARVRTSVFIQGDKIHRDGVDVGAVLRKAYAEIVNYHYPVEWAAGQLGGEEAQKQMKHQLAAFRGFEGAALFSINAEGRLGHYQTNLKGERVGEDYFTIIQNVNRSKEMFEDFAVYNIARRAADYFDRGLELPDSKDTYALTVTMLDAKYPGVFAETFRKLVEYRRNNLHLLVEGEVMPQETFDEIMESHPNYAPLQRLLGTGTNAAMKKVSLRAGSGRNIGGSRKVVHELRGGGEDIINPIESDINNTFLYLSAAQRNKILVNLADMADDTEGAGEIMSRSKTKYEMTSFNLAQLKSLIEEQLGALTNNDFDVEARVYKPNYLAGANQVVIYKEGKPVLYDLDHELYLSLMDASPVQANLLVKTAINIASFQRNAIVFTPKYILRNFGRDTLQNLIASRSGINPIDIVGGLVDAARHGEGSKMASRSGGATNYFTTNDRKYAQEAITDILAGRSKAAQYWNKTKHPLRTLQDIIEAGEMAGRISEFKKTLVKLGNDEKAVNEAVYNMRDISVDFKRMGRWIRKYNANRLVNFLNSNIQGADKLARMFSTREKSWKTIWRSLLYITLPTLLLAWMCRDNENYDDLPWYRKDFFWNIPMGDSKTAKNFISLPRPWELGILFGTIPERLFNRAYRDDPTAWDVFGESLVEALAPDIMPSALEPFYYDATGKKWNGVPILNTQDKKYTETSPNLQYNKYTSEVSKMIANLAVNLPYAPDWMKSPKRLDQIITGYTGSIGDIGLDSIDQALGTKEGIPVLSGLSEGFVTYGTRSPRSSDDFYTYKDRLESDYAVYLVTGEAPEGFAPHIRKVFTEVSSQLTDLKKKETEIEAMPNSNSKEQLLDELRTMEITLMRAANAVYEKEYFGK